MSDINDLIDLEDISEAIKRSTQEPQHDPQHPMPPDSQLTTPIPPYPPFAGNPMESSVSPSSNTANIGLLAVCLFVITLAATLTLNLVSPLGGLGIFVVVWMCLWGASTLVGSLMTKAS